MRLPTISTLNQTLRGLTRTPVFTVVVVASLAFGIGGNAAIFSIVNALFLHPAGVKDPSRVVAPRVTYKKLHLDRIDVSVPDFVDVRDSKQTFSSAALSEVRGLNYTGGESPQRIQGAAVSSEWFNVFGATAASGRGFQPEDDHPGANNVVVLSFDLWKRMFGSDPSAIGRVIELDQKPYRVVGVMPASFRWPSQADLWLPLALPAKAFAATARFNESYTAVARLQPGISLTQCEQAMGQLTARAKRSDKRLGAFAQDSQWSMVVEPFTELISGDLKLSLFVLSASVGLVLLIACSNIAGLMLVRGSGRSRELAVRRALGASTANLVSQSLTEMSLLAAAGTALGMLSTSGLLTLLLWIAPARITAGLVIESGTDVLLFAALAGALTLLFFGSVTVWQISRSGETYAALKDGGRSDTASVSRGRTRSALVIGQIALALVLLLGTGFLLSSLSRLRSTELGFDPSHVMTGATRLPDAAYHEPSKRTAFFRTVVDDLKSSPGVMAAAAADPIPFSGDGGTGSFSIQGRPQLPGDPGPHAYHGYVSPDYFAAFRIPLRKGRTFTDADREGSQPVAIVDASLAQMYWPGKDPVGKKIRIGPPDGTEPWITIVGIVNHVRAYDFSPTDTRGVFYQPVYQEPVPGMNFVVRTNGDPQLAAALIDRAVHKLDRSVAVFDFATPMQRISKTLGPRQFAVDLLTAFACAAMALAALGLYGVISFSAAQRTRELGIRSALGASRAQILFLIAGDGVRLIGIGVAAGAAISLIAFRALSSQLENVWFDPASFCSAILILTAVATLAAAIPAWRSATGDALSALRTE